MQTATHCIWCVHSHAINSHSGKLDSKGSHLGLFCFVFFCISSEAEAVWNKPWMAWVSDLLHLALRSGAGYPVSLWSQLRHQYGNSRKLKGEAELKCWDNCRRTAFCRAGRPFSQLPDCSVLLGRHQVVYATQEAGALCFHFCLQQEREVELGVNQLRTLRFTLLYKKPCPSLGGWWLRKQIEGRSSYWPLMQTRPSVKWCCWVAEKTKPFQGKDSICLVQSLPIWFVLSLPLETEPPYMAGKLSTAKLSQSFLLLWFFSNVSEFLKLWKCKNVIVGFNFPLILKCPLHSITAALCRLPNLQCTEDGDCSHSQLLLQFLCEDC